MAARATSRSAVNKQALVVGCLLWVVVLAVSRCEAAAKHKPRHDNFGKFHTVHYVPFAPSPASFSYPEHYLSKPGSSSAHLSLAVEGVVVCQSCRFANTNSLLHSTPIQGAKVKLVCRDFRFKTFVYETGITNKQGYFLIRVESYQFKRHNGVSACKVVLVSSGSPSCARITNVNAGKVGAPLTARAKVYKDEILYSVGPFAFSPSPSSCYKH